MPTVRVSKLVGIVEEGAVVRGYYTEHSADDQGREATPRDVELTPTQLLQLQIALDLLGVS